nr:DNA-directed DNA polymerase [Tanacetum cinerariifolium]
MAEISKNLMRVLQVNQQVKAVTPNYETCGGPHSYTDCPATVGQTQNVYAAGAYQGNTITNPKEDLKGITTRSGTAYQGPTIPTTSSFFPKVVEHETETENLIQNSEPVVAPIIEPIVAPVSAPKPNQKPSIPYLYRLHDQKLRDKANDKKEKHFQIFKYLNFNISFADALIPMPKFGSTIKTLLTNKDKLYELARTPLNEHCSAVLLKKLPEKLGDPGKFLIPCDFPRMDECLALADLGASINLMPLSAITFNLDQTSRCSANYNDMMANRINVIDMACEEYSQEVLGFSNVIVSGNPTPYYDPIVSTSSSTLTSFGDSDFLFEEVDAFLALEDDPTSPKVDQSYFDTKGDILLLESFLNDDPSLPPPNQGNYLPQVRKELKICKAKTDKSSIDEPPEVELKDLLPHLEYVFLEGDDKLPVIIDKYLMEDDFEPAVQHQRRVNPRIHDVIKKEVLKLLDAGLIYPISESPWLNEATRKDHFPLPFMDQMLERLAGNEYYCFLDGFSGYFQIPIDPKDQEKASFTCPYGTFAYRRMPFGLCNAPSTFQSHKISKNRIEIDKAKVDVIAKLPHPTTVKGIRSFLGHAGFYRRFIQYFSKIAQLITRLLEKDTTFFFPKECVEAFQTLKRKLIEASILIAPDRDLPFELMCDASDFAIGVVLGKHHDKHFRPIHYASKTMTDAELNYTTTKKEMLAVVYAFEKLQSYLIMNKSIVYTDQSALKYLFAKKDSKARLF